MKYSMNLKNKRKKSLRRKKKDFNSRAMSPSRLSPSYGKFKTGKRSRSGLFSKKAKMKKTFSKIVLISLGIFFFLFVGSLIAGGVYLRNIERSLPDPGKLVERTSDQSTIIYDRNGHELYTIYGDENREFVEIDSLPDHLKWAVLAAEDIEFYRHKGLDLVSVARAAYANLVLGRVARGASTVTQQLVRNTILHDFLGDEAFEQTYSRKIQEMLITMQVEQNLTKDEILQMYLNEIPFGGVHYGIQSAAQAYFDKDAEDLTLAESAMLAGVIASPTTFSPIYGSDPDLSIRRQHIVLDLMLRNSNVTGVTAEEIEEAKEEELEYASQRMDIDAPHFVFYVRQELEKMFDTHRVERGGLRVTTSLDYSIQEIAEEEIRNGVKQYGHRWNVHNGAMVALDPHTNQILAMVGSIDYWNQDDPKIDGNVNVVTASRQMGSAVKPYTYLAAFSQGYGPWLQTPDISGLNFGNYELRNWDGNYYGHMTARQALLQSRNVPAVYTAQLIGGVDPFIETAEKLGVTSLVHRDQYGLSITLGAAEIPLLEHTSAFTTFATGGIKRPPASILKVVDSKGEVLYEYEDNGGERVFNEREIYAMNWILCDIGGFGDQPQNHLYMINGRRALCGKTGTTDGPRDLTSIMYHQNLVVGVWAGNNDNTEVPGAWSTTVPLPIAHSFMNRVSSQYEPGSFTRPSGIVATRVCRDTGRIGSEDYCDTVSTIYMEGNAPPRDDREKIMVCKDSGLISENEELAERFGLLEEKILIEDYKLENARQDEIYKSYLLDRNSDLIFSRPDSGECELPAEATKEPKVEIRSPSTGSEVIGGRRINIDIDANPGMGVDKIEVEFNGSLIPDGTLTKSPYRVGFTLPDGLEQKEYVLTVTLYDENGKVATDSIRLNYKLEEDEKEDDED